VAAGVNPATEPGRRAGHLFLDVISAFNPADDIQDGAHLATRALDGLAANGCITAQVDPATGLIHADTTLLFRGVLTLLFILFERIEESTGWDRSLIVARVRELLDEAFEEQP
jgi:hypothetical protein